MSSRLQKAEAPSWSHRTSQHLTDMRPGAGHNTRSADAPVEADNLTIDSSSTPQAARSSSDCKDLRHARSTHGSILLPTLSLAWLEIWASRLPPKISRCSLQGTPSTRPKE